MPLTFDPKGRFKKPNRNNPASKVRQPGTINDGLKSAAREQGNQGAKSTQQGKANYGGDVQPQSMGDRPFDPPDAYSREVQRAGSNIPEDLANSSVRKGLDKYAPVINSFTGMKQLGKGADYVKDVYNKGFMNATGRAVNDLNEFGGEVAGDIGNVVTGVGRDVGQGLDAFSAGVQGEDYLPPQEADNDFTAFDDEFGDLPGAFNRDISPEGQAAEAALIGGGTEQVGDLAGVGKSTYTRDDGSEGTLYSNTVQPEEAVDAEGYTASGRFMGVNPGESDYDRNTAGLSEINKGISDLLTNPEQVAANDRGLDDLLAYNENKKVRQSNQKQRGRLRAQMKRGRLSGRRFAEAMGKLGASDIAVGESELEGRAIQNQGRLADAETRKALSFDKQAGSKAGASRYATDVGRQTELDKISSTTQDTLRKGAFDTANAQTKMLGDLFSSPEGLDMLRENPDLLQRMLGEGGGGQDPRALLEAMRKGV